MLDISITTDLEVELQDIGDQRGKEALTRASTQLYCSFTASNSQFITEMDPEKSHDLQRLFYQKILDGITEGVHLYFPSKDGPPPAMFGLKGHTGRKEGMSIVTNKSDDAVSVSLSIASEQDEHEREQDSWLPASAKPLDTQSISSGVSGNLTGGAVSHSVSGMNLCNDSNTEADDEQAIYEDDDDQAIYEDIEEICEKLKREVDAEATTGASVSEEVKEVGKKASILSFLKKKTKGKKGKNKQSLDTYVEVDFPDTSAEPNREGSTKESSAQDLIPTPSRSSSESYDEMKPNSGYISDNYEECEFNTAAPQIPNIEFSPPVVNVPEPTAKKKKMPKKSLKPVLPEAGSIPPISTDDLMLFKDKKGKMKELISLKRSDTLPRKMKMGTFEKKAPPISTISDFPANAKVTDIDLSEQVWVLTNQVERLKVQVKELFSAVEALTAQNLPSQEESEGPAPSSTPEENVLALKEMNLEQVSKVCYVQSC